MKIGAIESLSQIFLKVSLYLKIAIKPLPSYSDWGITTANMYKREKRVLKTRGSESKAVAKTRIPKELGYGPAQQ